ncbi:Lipoprotein [Flavobacterium branchiophilum]|uniref:Uncharacterized protein n=2 Tax=Flavobacterium branchiophilum TaxID=55197 RepID=G2Z5J0_FLABF|nr:hypothetical protein [Flavobacterium branchiophilum]PDS26394.1 hypothetical protein B0A77_02455 [Flavobacterium branchiophilum]CCB70788.1 Hypothetical protein FBFL15_2801 [Flavobacterium branchiophilum FL-15]
MGWYFKINEVAKKYRIQKILLLLIYCCINFSCVSLKKLEQNDKQVTLTKSNLNLLNGTYQNNNENYDIEYEYFWGSFLRSSEFKKAYLLANKGKRNYIVSINVISEKKINIEISINGEVIKSKIIKGKIKNGYFEQNRKLFTIPALLVNVFHNSKLRIGLLNNGNIITDKKSIEFGTYYFFYPFLEKKNYINQEHIKTQTQ